MFSRDLAELIGDTARKAADASKPDGAELEGPSIDEALAELERLKAGLDEDGLEAELERRRESVHEPGAENPAKDPQFTGRPVLGLSDEMRASLQATIELLGRYRNGPPAGGEGSAPQGPVGKATSPTKLVAVEATIEHPISQVWLSKRACEIGPKALSEEVTETAAAAAAELASMQDSYTADLGLPIGPGFAAQLPDLVRQRGAKIVGQAKFLVDHQRGFEQRMKEGGHYG